MWWGGSRLKNIYTWMTIPNIFLPPTKKNLNADVYGSLPVQIKDIAHEPFKKIETKRN